MTARLAALLHAHACETGAKTWQACRHDHASEATWLRAAGVTLAQPAPDALRVAAQDLLVWLDAEVAYPREEPHPAMKMQADILRAALEADPDRPLTRDEMLRYRVQHNTKTGLHPDARDILEDQPPRPGGTTAIRDGKYVREITE